jgi:hypothetical protein
MPGFLDKVFGQVRLKFSGLRQKQLWDLTAKTLDLAVAFYSCANVEQPYYGPSPLTDEAVIPLWAEPRIIFGAVLRNLDCLNGILQSRKVWVFYTLGTGQLSNQPIQERALYLTARIKDLGDIWGPGWGIWQESQPGVIRAYEIGGGSIVPWKHDPSLLSDLEGNERLCYWQRTEGDLLKACTHLQNSMPSLNLRIPYFGFRSRIPTAIRFSPARRRSGYSFSTILSGRPVTDLYNSAKAAL